MEIYVEYLILDNFMANAFILDATLRVNKRYKRSALLRGSLVATAIGLVYPLLMLSPILDAAFKLFSSVLIVISSCKSFTMHEFMAHLVFFYVFSFIYGGFVLAITGGRSYITSEGLSAILGAGGLALLYIKRQITRFFSLRGRLSVKTQISNGEYLAIWDTGNNLVTSEGFPVIVLSPDIKGAVEFLETDRNFMVKTVSGEYETKLNKLENMSVLDDNTMSFGTVYFIFSENVLDNYKVILNERLKYGFGGTENEKLFQTISLLSCLKICTM